MNEVKYIVCYTIEEADGMNVTCVTERFDNFTEAVGRYTLFCGVPKRSVILADVENNKILQQFGYIQNSIVIN
ncbi:MAG: hypothetical protein IJJ69_07460 [Oscillospiraceae bacterium]|jgi:hypothetical protein|nr:hypothetical protein [Ruminococcus sp.]MBR0484596.1 hypothetical protein [Oscillospiraceae bacterium]